MTRAIINVGCPVASLLVTLAMIYVVMREPVWAHVAIPLALAQMSFANDYGYRGHDAGQALTNAFGVLFMTGLISVAIFLFATVPATI